MTHMPESENLAVQGIGKLESLTAAVQENNEKVDGVSGRMTEIENGLKEMERKAEVKIKEDPTIIEERRQKGILGNVEDNDECKAILENKYNSLTEEEANFDRKLLYLVNKIKRHRKSYTDESITGKLERALSYNLLLKFDPHGENNLEDVISRMEKRYNSPSCVLMEKSRLENVKLKIGTNWSTQIADFISNVEVFNRKCESTIKNITGRQAKGKKAHTKTCCPCEEKLTIKISAPFFCPCPKHKCKECGGAQSEVLHTSETIEIEG